MNADQILALYLIGGAVLSLIFIIIDETITNNFIKKLTYQIQRDTRKRIEKIQEETFKYNLRNKLNK